MACLACCAPASSHATEAQAASPSAATAGLSPTIAAAAQTGIVRIYSMDFEGAGREFQKILAEDPEQPFAFYGPAAASWVRFVYGSGRNDPAMEAAFEKDVETSIQKSSAWIKKHPRDAYALLALGGSYGLRSRLSLVHHRWFRAVLDGRRAIKATRDAQKADPNLADVYLGIGMWEYYSDVFPRMVKSLGRLLLGGNRQKGIEHIQFAAEKGRFVHMAARLLLIEMSLEDPYGFRDPARAVKMIREVRKDYPDSPIFAQIEQVSLYEAGEHEACRHLTDEYVRRIITKSPNFLEIDLPRMHLFYGTIAFAKNDLVQAAKEFETAAGMVGANKAAPNRWALWARMRWGEVEDALGHAAQAKAHYKEIYNYPDLFGYYAWVKNRLSHPYVARSPLGPVSPP